MTLKTILLISFAVVTAGVACAQTAVNKTSIKKEQGPSGFPTFSFANIPGAPKLAEPVLINGSELPVVTGGHGLTGPAFYDWDGDGLNDLLIGEFGTGVEEGKLMGHFIRVYLNTGTQENPQFTGRFDYARPPFKLPGNGTPYSVDQFCCIGFTPQFIDLNNDGMQDMITGSYYGEVYVFYGSKEGFLPGVALLQEPPTEGDPRNGATSKKAHQYYWLYSSASFGDFTGDGKPDLVTGGRALKLSRNTGSSTNPQFSTRELLLDINGKPLTVHTYTAEELKFFEARKSLGYEAPIGGDFDISPYVVDWDNDGVMDILATNSYMHKGLEAVDFFKGVNTTSGIRFQPAVPLFTVQQGKALPGMGPRITVTDYNNDGINDLLVGTSVVTINNVFNGKLSWEWQDKNNILAAGKDPANLKASMTATAWENYKKQQASKVPPGISLEEFTSIRHVGYVYVMLGKR